MRRTSLGLMVLLSALTIRGAEPNKVPTLIVKPDAFKTLVNPNCSHCRDEAKRRAGQLRNDDRVLCWIRDTKGQYDGGAIPYRFFLNPYRVISEWCEGCRGPFRPETPRHLGISSQLVEILVPLLPNAFFFSGVGIGCKTPCLRCSDQRAIGVRPPRLGRFLRGRTCRAQGAAKATCAQ